MSKIWVFGSNNGKGYSDNSRHFFEFVSESNSSNIKAVWISKNLDIVSEVRSMGYESYHSKSIKGLYYCIISNAVFYSSSHLDLPILTYINGRFKKIINLWHGTPLKRLDVDVFLPLKRMMLNTFKLFLGKEFDYIVSDTEENEEIYKKVFNIASSQIINSGQPRNDILAKNDKSRKKTSILFAPTWREYDADYNFFAKEYKPEILLDYIKNNKNIEFKISLHPATPIHNIEKIKSLKNIEIIKYKDANQYLNKVDILITDYSSIYIDFMLLEKPVLSSAFDINTYIKNRGFYYNYESVFPDKVRNNWGEVVDKIDDCINSKNISKKYKSIQTKFHIHKDNKRRSRLLNFLTNEK